MKDGVSHEDPRARATGRWTITLLVGAALIIWLGCGGEKTFAGGLGPPSPLVSISITPALTTVHPTSSMAFGVVGTLSDGTEVPVTPSYTAQGGVIDAAGRYTAGLTPGIYPIIARHGALADTAWATVLDPNGPFQAPDLADLLFDTGDYSAITNFPGATPRHLAAPTGGLGDSPGLEMAWAPSAPDYSPARVKFPTGSHRFVRVYFRLTAPMLHNASNIKVFRFSDPNRGGIFSNSSQAWGFGFDQEASAVVASIGVFESAAPASYVTNVGAQYVHAENIADGAWHSIEIEYDRNAPGSRVEARIWFDGRPIVMPPSVGKGAWASDGYWWAPFEWSGGAPGVYPSTLSAPRTGTGSLDTFGLVEEMSGGLLNSGSMFLDQIAVSTSRIGL